MMSKTFEKAKERQEELFIEIASLLSGLTSPVRLKIIHFLSQAPHSVEQLSLKLGQSVANTSMHLKKMQREDILKAETSGQKRIYSLAHLELKTFWEQIQDYAQIQDPTKIIDSEAIYHENLLWEKSLKETIKDIKSQKVLLLDVRPNDEVDEDDPQYSKYVVHIPFDNLKRMKDELPANKPLLIICRGRLCVMSNESTHQLRKMGFEAFKGHFSWFQLSQAL
jgi:DNA-binding transcriptional ArsR family regulator